MKKKLSPAEAPLRALASDEEAAEYFDRTPSRTFGIDFPRTSRLQLGLSSALATSIRARHIQAKSPVSLRLEPEQIAAVKKIVATKSVGDQTQLRMWVAGGIRRETKRA